MGIKFQCKACKKIVEFPDCPNADTDRWEKLAFGIYTMKANEGVCSSACFKKNKHKK